MIKYFIHYEDSVNLIILVLSVLFFLYLFFESINAKKYRKSFEHVIYVNGTRGKSSVTRLIDSVLRAGGKKVFSKTTGTEPIYIDTKGVEHLIKRRGCANIKEQLWTMKKAYKEGAEILVIECMAVNPDLQFISQNQMVQADIGVITNVRHDHVEEMGDSLEQICDSLCSTMPKNGGMFTADKNMFQRIQRFGNKYNTQTYLSVPTDDNLFSDNYQLALDIGKYLHIDKTLALQGIKNFKHDPYDLKIYAVGTHSFFINGLSINDSDSIKIVFSYLKLLPYLKNLNFVLLINNRADRGMRALEMIQVANELKPDKTILMGSFANVLKKKIKHGDVEILSNRADFDIERLKNTMIFSVGNIANSGKELISYIETKGTLYVRENFAP
ncbi:poly-gamma-glutamate synthase PgsB [Treponema phagedenis]|uniref:poly-gamma-glutamate synthase PgsB n=1 Tax=Treponema phagedenis TaxID=162 RepID=UPI0001F63FD8|nr:poly-gamma-glutamate synthase PgsB [Treponema phagedenis]EFW37089.1 poly-gamma-glutamate synthase PgsB [Treponema phagedenis F0421]TYT79621.1 poly-gamma-glutamate synthase PgsB [Treponema phagedenis]